MCQAQAIQWLCENTDTDDEETDATEAACETATIATPAAESTNKETTMTDDV